MTHVNREAPPDVSWIHFETHGKYGLGRARTVRYDRPGGGPILVEGPKPWTHPSSLGVLAINVLFGLTFVAVVAACLGLALWEITL